MEVRQPKGREIYKVAEALGIRSMKVDGNNVGKVVMETENQIEMMRAGKGPVFIEYETYRWREHCGPNFDNEIGYRSENEFQEWKKRILSSNIQNKYQRNSLKVKS